MSKPTKRIITFQRRIGNKVLAYSKIEIKEDATDYFFKKWFKLVKRDNLNYMKVEVNNSGHFSYSRVISTPNKFHDFKQMMKEL